MKILKNGNRFIALDFIKSVEVVIVDYSYAQSYIYDYIPYEDYLSYFIETINGNDEDRKKYYPIEKFQIPNKLNRPALAIEYKYRKELQRGIPALLTIDIHNHKDIILMYKENEEDIKTYFSFYDHFSINDKNTFENYNQILINLENRIYERCKKEAIKLMEKLNNDVEIIEL